ncbi:hypothetical protein ACGFZL_12405 [Streptomyces sp. NPDC048182]|uniref:hypothetical protein n=1 Tax=Streptomyces sp. NPDC048182 TaxID=3365507 RepID=UPI003712C030
MTPTLSDALGHGASGGGILQAAFGLGTLAGSLAVSLRPLRGEPEGTVVRCVALAAVAVAVSGLVPAYGAALVALALAGVCNGPFVAATLTARARYAPAGARAQIFVTVAGIKIGAASLGAALAGLLAPLSAGGLLLVTAGATGTAVLYGLADRQVSGAEPKPVAAP